MYQENIPQSSRLLAESIINTNEDLLSFLVRLFEEEEKAIELEHRKSYVTDDYENGVKSFAVVLIIVLRAYVEELKQSPNFETLYGKRHVAYGYFCVRNRDEIFADVRLDEKYEKHIYKGLLEFYTKFYGKFADNEEAIELLCKYYPYQEDEEIRESVKDTATALYQHISSAGTPNDMGYAYGGIEQIKRYIGMLPVEVISNLLNEYDIYHVINNRVYRHQISAIILYSAFEPEKKRTLKFRCLDSLLIGDRLSKHLIRKMETERGFIDDHNNYYDYKLMDERYYVLDEPEVFWDNTKEDERTLYIVKKSYIKVYLQDENVTVEYEDYAVLR